MSLTIDTDKLKSAFGTSFLPGVSDRLPNKKFLNTKQTSYEFGRTWIQFDAPSKNILVHFLDASEGKSNKSVIKLTESDALDDIVEKIEKLKQTNIKTARENTTRAEEVITAFKQSGHCKYPFLSVPWSCIVNADNWKLNSHGADILLQADAGYHFFRIYFRNPHGGEVFLVTTKGVEDFPQAMTEVQRQMDELLHLKPTQKGRSQTGLHAIKIETPPLKPHIKLESLKDMFHGINFKDPELPGYRSPDLITNDGEPVTVFDLVTGIDALLRHIDQAEPWEGVPDDPTERLNFYNILKCYLTNIVEKLQSEKDPAVKSGHVINIAKLGLECGIHWLSNTIQILAALNGQTIPSMEAIDLDDEIMGWMLELREGTVDEMVAEGGSNQNSHEYLKYRRALRRVGISIHSVDKKAFGDPGAREALKGKFKTEEEIIDGFEAKFNAKKIIDFIHVKLNMGLQLNPNAFGWSIQDVLRSYIKEKFAGDARYVQQFQAIESLEKKFQLDLEATEINPLFQEEELKSKLKQWLDELPVFATAFKEGKLQELLDKQEFPHPQAKAYLEQAIRDIEVKPLIEVNARLTSQISQLKNFVINELKLKKVHKIHSLLDEIIDDIHLFDIEPNPSISREGSKAILLHLNYLRDNS